MSRRLLSIGLFLLASCAPSPSMSAVPSHPQVAIDYHCRGVSIAPGTSNSITVHCTPAPTATPAATTVPSASPSATPSPSAKPSATPSPTPTATPTAAPGTLANGIEWPLGFRPYAPTSIWNTRITNPDAPIIYSQSAAIVANMAFHYTPLSLNTQEFTPGSTGGPYSDDVSHPVVFASATDPLITAQCVQFCTGWSTTYSPGVTGGFGQIRIPPKARPSGSSDHHLTVIQPDGTEIDMWAVVPPTRDWQYGDTLQFGDGQNQGNFYTGGGQAGQNGTAWNAATAGGAALAAGLIRQSEFANHLIPHALFLASGCVGVAHVYPGIQNGDNTCNGPGAQVPFGAHFWWAQTDAQIDALAIPVDQKTVLHALHQYGGYVMDSGGNTTLAYTDGIAAYMEDGTQFGAFGVSPPPMDAYAASMGWPTQQVQVPEFYLSDPGLNWSQFFQILDPCYAQKTC